MPLSCSGYLSAGCTIPYTACCLGALGSSILRKRPVASHFCLFCHLASHAGQASSVAFSAALVAVFVVHLFFSSPNPQPHSLGSRLPIILAVGLYEAFLMQFISISAAAQFSHLEPSLRRGCASVRPGRLHGACFACQGRPAQAGCSSQAKHAPKRAARRSSAPALCAPHPNPVAQPLAQEA